MNPISRVTFFDPPHYRVKAISMKMKVIKLQGQATRFETDWSFQMKRNRKPKLKIRRRVTLEPVNRAEEYSIVLSEHARTRASQRGITYDMIMDAMDFGTLIQKQGLVFYVVKKKNLPNTLPAKKRRQLNNLVVVLNGNLGMVVTCYRAENGIRHITLKSDSLARAQAG